MHRIRQNQNRWSRACFADQGKSAFSLIELLVVIVVVSILAAFLSTALNQTRQRAHQITCLNNLRELSRAWYFYADDNQEWLALNRSLPGSQQSEFSARRHTAESWVAGNPMEDTSTDPITSGSLFPYTKSVSLYRCPSDESTVVDQPVLRNRSYAMSTYMNGDGAGMDPRVKTRLTEINNPSPSKMFVFIEEHESSIWSGGFYVSPKSRFSLASASWSSTPSDRHAQGCNISFADLHVEHWKWAWPKGLNLNNHPAQNHQELRDLQRLQDSVPFR